MLATGLILFTVLGIAFFADRFITALDFRSGFLLGAVVAATDAVAAGSIARTLGISPRLTGLIEGESMLNDATGLLALEFGLALLLSGSTFSIHEGVLRLLWLIVGGLGAGLLLGSIMAVVERWISDGPLEMATSIIVPYVAYLVADEIRASGVLSVVACGLYLSRRSASFLNPTARIELMSAWKALDFILNGVVFLLIGLQLPYILAGIHEYSAWTLLLYGLSFSLMLIVLRMAWVFPGAYVSAWIRRHIFRQDAPNPSAKSTFVLGWAGMRGVLALAAALSLPETLSDGRPFAQRSLILFLTFSIILVTLVGQGLTLPPLIRYLGLSGNTELAEEELTARCTMLTKAIGYLRQRRTSASESEFHDIDDILHRYQHRLEAISISDRISHASGRPENTTQSAADRHLLWNQLVLETVAVERRTLLNLQENGTVGDEVLRSLERELDLTESRYESRN
jgi:CPA1 family monovalent cation:H+ antiporter